MALHQRTDHSSSGAISRTRQRPGSGSSERGADTLGGCQLPEGVQRLAPATKVATMYVACRSRERLARS
jgi:hypothetical protein